MFCKYCGNQLDDLAVVCPRCGRNADAPAAYDDRPSFGLALLGFFIPIVGLILFLVYEGKKPQRAKSAGKGALVGFISSIVLSIIITVITVVAGVTGMVSLISTIPNYTEDFDDEFGNSFYEEINEELLPGYNDFYIIEG